MQGPPFLDKVVDECYNKIVSGNPSLAFPFAKRPALPSGAPVVSKNPKGLTEGKALDMFQTAAILGFDSKIVGCTNDYAQTANSDVVVITSGIPRKPGMTREELIGVNAGIVKSVVQNVLKFSPKATVRSSTKSYSGTLNR